MGSGGVPAALSVGLSDSVGLGLGLSDSVGAGDTVGVNGAADGILLLQKNLKPNRLLH